MKHKQIWMLVPVALLLGLVSLFLVQRTAAGPAPTGVATPHKPAAAKAGSWSSGWITVTRGDCQQLEHNLGGDPNDYGVELWFLDTDNGRGINRRGYGRTEVGGYWRGAFFQHLQSNTVEVCRAVNDLWVDQIFFRIWEVQTATLYDSGWRDIAPDSTLVITHNLGISATELSASLWFSSALRGIHHAGYGSLSNDNAQQLHGAYWKNLDEHTIRIKREADDVLVEQVRVIVARADPPAYDSGWQPMGLGDVLHLDHNLNQKPALLRVRAECKSADLPGPGIHQQYAGGNHDWFIGWQGAALQNLTANSIEVDREVNDQVCPQVRVRIWRLGYQVFLPLALRNN